MEAVCGNGFLAEPDMANVGPFHSGVIWSMTIWSMTNVLQLSRSFS